MTGTRSCAGRRRSGAGIADVHGVVVTHHHPDHHHPDHHGLSGQAREAAGAWIVTHPADAGVVRRTRHSEPSAWTRYLADKRAAAGAPPEHVDPLRAARPTAPPGGRPALPDRDIAPGRRLDLPGRAAASDVDPGPHPGHVCLCDEDARRLFSGDHLLPGISPHIGLYENPDDPTATDPLGDHLDSPARIGRLDAAEVLPAHQHAFTGAAGRVRELAVGRGHGLEPSLGTTVLPLPRHRGHRGGGTSAAVGKGRVSGAPSGQRTGGVSGSLTA